MTQNLGWLSFVAIVVGDAVLIAAVTISFWLWFTDERDHEWRFIAASGWIPRTVALAALGIRIAVAFRSTTSTGMLAALALERSPLPLSSLASVSITRYSNNGLLLLFCMMLRRLPCYSQMQTCLLLSLLGLTFLTSGPVQLSSRVVLSDLTSEHIVVSHSLMSSVLDSGNLKVLSFPAYG